MACGERAGPLRDGLAGQAKRTRSDEAIWQEWFAPLFAYVEANRDMIRAVAYINADWDSQSMWAAPYAEGYWGDSRLEANPEITRRWLHGSPALRSQLEGS